MKVCIFGAASPQIDQIYKDGAYILGKALAEAGHTLVFGGGGEGMMGAFARGFHDHQGKTIGIIPEFFKDGVGERLDEDCDEVIYTRDISERLRLMEEKSDAFIALPGGIGTYEEFFKVLVSVSLDRHSKPIVLYDIEGFFDPLIALLQDGADKNFIPKERLHKFRVFDENGIEELKEYLAGR